MSSFIYLLAMVGVAWLVLWTIRDPKERTWEWWPIEWWPFDTDAEAQIERAAENERQAALDAGGRRDVPWRERRVQQRRGGRSHNPRWQR